MMWRLVQATAQLANEMQLLCELGAIPGARLHDVAACAGRRTACKMRCSCFVSSGPLQALACMMLRLVQATAQLANEMQLLCELGAIAGGRLIDVAACAGRRTACKCDAAAL